MNNINPCFKTKKILHFVADLIVSYDYTSYFDLSDDAKQEFTAELIEAAGRPGEAECINESANFDQLINSLKKSLKCGSKDNDLILLETIKNNAVEYYESTMEAIFNYVHEDYTAERNEWMDTLSNNGDPDEIYASYLEGLS